MSPLHTLRLRRALAGAATIAGASTASLPARAQAPGATDIFVAPLLVDGGTLRVGTFANATARPGYDNQPMFTPDGRSVLYTAIGDDAQADIWRIDIGVRTPVRLTATSESEYSATPVPGQQRFSVIRVERDSTQRLWSFLTDGSDPRLVFRDVRPVGYHAWVNAQWAAMFVLGTPATLWLGDAASGAAFRVASDIGRSIVSIPGTRAVSFLQRADSAWWLMRLEHTGSLTGGNWVTSRVGRMPPGAEYVAWFRDGRALTGTGTRLLELAPGATEWRVVADLADQRLERISRLALSPDGRWLALVAEPAAP